jgi:hypothetical protein
MSTGNPQIGPPLPPGFRTSGAEGADDHGTTESAISRFITDIAGVIVSPTATLRNIGERGAVIPALMLVILIAVLSTGIGVAVLLAQASPATGPASPAVGFLLGFQLVNLLWNLVWYPVFWTIMAGMLFGIAWMLGGRGRFQALWAASGFALIPQLLTVPLLAGQELVGVVGGPLQILTALVLIPVWLGAFGWNLVLLTIAIRETMNVSTGRAAGVLGLLILALLLIAALIACVLIIIFALFISAAVA